LMMLIENLMGLVPFCPFIMGLNQTHFFTRYPSSLDASKNHRNSPKFSDGLWSYECRALRDCSQTERPQSLLTAIQRVFPHCLKNLLTFADTNFRNKENADQIEELNNMKLSATCGLLASLSLFAGCGSIHGLLSKGAAENASDGMTKETQNSKLESESEKDIKSEAFPPGLELGQTASANSAVLFYDPFAQGCWKVKYTRGSPEGSCATNVAGPSWDHSQMQSSASGRVVDLTGASGAISKVMRFTWEKKHYLPLGPKVTSLENNTSKKAHLWTSFESGTGKARSYSFSTFARKSELGPDSKVFSTGEVTRPEVIAQWKGYPNTAKDEPFTIPVLTVKADRGKWLVEASYDESEVSTETSMKWVYFDEAKSKNKKWLGNIDYDKWTHWNVKVKWSCCSKTGYLKISRYSDAAKGWVEEVNLQNIQIGQNDAKDPNMGIGIYKYTGSSFFDLRRVYFDNVRIDSLN
jgi:hypothetical protein